MRWWLLVVLLGAACSGGSSSSVDAPAGAEAIEAPAETWTWIPIDGTQCGNGAPTGIGVNLTDRSDNIVFLLQGGGACWDALTCFQLKSAVNIETGYGKTNFDTEIAQLGGAYFWQRNVATNPFKDASYIYVPYCTGDLHDGTRVAAYTFNGAPRTVAHVGSTNLEKILARVHATKPNAQTIWLTGISAGAYGVAFNLDMTRASWPSAQVHGLSDSSPLVTTEPTRWQSMQTEWAMRFPAACTDCPSNLGAMPAALRAEAPAGSRYGLLSYTRDNVIATYFGLAQADLETAINAEVAGFDAKQGAWLVAGTEHVLLGKPTLLNTDNVSVQTWVDQWATGDAAWATSGP
jgi:hypothetical protein